MATGQNSVLIESNFLMPLINSQKIKIEYIFLNVCPIGTVTKYVTISTLASCQSAVGEFSPNGKLFTL
jgi:hypothetical protein